ncbi:unnamed protein product [Sphagnum jensenii]
MKNYDIEMWRYAKELKRLSTDPEIGHEHIPKSSAVLENVEIRINERGLRGPPLRAISGSKRRIIFLGDSIALGLGCPRERDCREQT